VLRRRPALAAGAALCLALLLPGCPGEGGAPEPEDRPRLPKEVLSAESMGGDAGVGASRAVVAGGLVFCSSVLPPGEALGANAGDQLRGAFHALGEVLREAGTEMAGLVRVTVYLTDLGEAAELESLWAELFPQAPPARTIVQVGGLPRGARVCLEAVAVRPLGRGLTAGEMAR